MKKVEVEKLVSKKIIATVAILCVMFGTWLIQQGYFSYKMALSMRGITIGVSAFFVLLAIALVILGVKKSSKFYFFASWCAVLATFTMLLKINYELGKGIQFMLFGHTIMLFPLAIFVMVLAIVAIWIYAIYKISRR